MKNNAVLSALRRLVLSATLNTATPASAKEEQWIEKLRIVKEELMFSVITNPLTREKVLRFPLTTGQNALRRMEKLAERRLASVARTYRNGVFMSLSLSEMRDFYSTSGGEGQMASNLTKKQEALDIDDDGEISGEDLRRLRKGETANKQRQLRDY